MIEVTMFTKNNCPDCMRAKMLFEHCPVENVRIEINIDENPGTKKMLDDKGVLSIPTFIINGEWIEGFKEGKIRDALGL